MAEITEFVKSISGLIAQIAALLWVLIALIRILREKRRTKREPNNQNKKRTNYDIISIFLAITILCAIGTIRYHSAPLSVRTELTIEAFNAFNAEKYELAIQKANAVIDENNGVAQVEEEKLEKNSAGLPPTGKVSDEQKKELFSHGLVNDFAAALYIKADTLRRLGRTSEAIAIYQEATKYRYARVYDPKEDVFWSPSEASQGKLLQLQAPKQ